MQKEHRLCTKRQYGYTYHRGQRSSCKEISLLLAKSKQKKIGIVANKKVGGAVIRNRSKRRVRAILQKYIPQLKNGFYVFVIRPSIVELSFQELESKITRCFKALNAFERIDN